ncbi:MAG TPA: hypothetical protein VNL13_04770 [Sulfolobales archaeon]|nr:hypothetical protein [Sulfolobales archaeon]
MKTVDAYTLVLIIRSILPLLLVIKIAEKIWRESGISTARDDILASDIYIGVYMAIK